MTKVRNTAGKFAAKSDVPRKVRSVNLTDNAWQWLAQTAEQAGISRNDYLEALADGSPIMETVQATSNPIMETVQAETKNTEKHPDIKVLPIMETVESEIESLRQQLEQATLQIHGYQDAEIRLKENYAYASSNAQLWSKQKTECQESLEKKEKEKQKQIEKYQRFFLEERAEKEALGEKLAEADALVILKNNEIAELKSQLAAKNQIISEANEQIERLESELASRSPAPTSTPIAIELPDAADLLNKLKGKRKKSKADLADLEAIVEILEGEL